MLIVKIFFSLRIWVMFSILASLAIWKLPMARAFVQGHEQLVLLIELSVLVVSAGISLYGIYSVEGVKEFVKDNLGDVLILLIASCSLTFMLSTGGLTAYWLPPTMMGISIFFAFFDYLFSLNGGASKLLEMDKERMSIDK